MPVEFYTKVPVEKYRENTAVIDTGSNSVHYDTDICSFKCGPTEIDKKTHSPTLQKQIGWKMLLFHSAEQAPRKGSSIVIIKLLSHAIRMTSFALDLNMI